MVDKVWENLELFCSPYAKNKKVIDVYLKKIVKQKNTIYQLY